MHITLLGAGIIQKILDFIVGILAFIPQTIYFLYSSVASLLDVLQYLVRKLAGLDVYYINGNAQTGDLVTDFLQGILGIGDSTSAAYSALSTVFWSLVIFGLILLILTTIVAIIKAHYNYDSNKSHPMKIVGSSLKSLALVAIVPIVSIFGIYLTQILLKTLDNITTTTSAGSLASVFEPNAVAKFEPGEDAAGNETYASFDYFSFGAYTNTSTFSGMLFKVAGYSCNRVRTGMFRVVTKQTDKSAWDNMDIFFVSATAGDQKERLASQIDYAFANNLQLKETYARVRVAGDDAWALGTSLKYGFGAIAGAQLNAVNSISKFNTGLVFYYYDLWAFNWILGFVGIVICAVLFGNIGFGLMARLLEVVGLFLIFPALIGIMPVDEGAGFTNWRKEFVSNILMAFGAIVGMNLFFIILPFFNTISFFNNSFVDGIVNMVIVIAGLTLVKKFISLVSKFSGGADAREQGEAVMADAKKAAIQGTIGTLTAGGLGIAVASPALGGLKAGAKGVANKIGNSKKMQKLKNAVTSKAQQQQDKKIRETFGIAEDKPISQNIREKYAALQGLSRRDRKAVIKETGVERGTLVNEKNFNLRMKANKDFNQKVAAKAQAKVDKRYKRANLVATVFNLDKSKIKKGEVDKSGNITSEGTKTGQLLGKAFTDFAQTAAKSIGQITGASSAWKALSDAGAVDQAKTTLKQFGKALGISESTMASNETAAKFTQTKAEKEAADKRALKKVREDQLLEMQEIAKNTKLTADAINQLVTEFKRNPPRR